MIAVVAMVLVGLIANVWLSWHWQQETSAIARDTAMIAAQQTIDARDQCHRTIAATRATLVSSRAQRQRDRVTLAAAEAAGNDELAAAIRRTTDTRDAADDALREIIGAGCRE